ncbi:MAG TPA: hypothetical protein PK542_09290 [Treponemataceae bacterium]|nr:hypothetical protein [Treponemataceae bacterium]HPS44667.1 hypothetical protein [Treponemataceae bacterium]
MNVALVSFCPTRDGKSREILKRLEAASVSRGNRVDVIDGNADIGDRRLTMYEYVAVVMKAPGALSAKVPPRVREFLGQSGTVVGKKGCALVIRSGLRSSAACANLMEAMEAEGVELDYFDVVRSADHASHAGKKIG